MLRVPRLGVTTYGSTTIQRRELEAGGVCLALLMQKSVQSSRPQYVSAG